MGVLQGGQLRFTQARAGDFEDLLALRIAAMRPSLERLGRFDAQRARDRLAAGFVPANTWHADWTPAAGDASPLNEPSVQPGPSGRSATAVSTQGQAHCHRVGFYAWTPAAQGGLELQVEASLVSDGSPDFTPKLIANYAVDVGQSANLDHFYLLPAFQGSGLGSRMLAHALASAGQATWVLCALKQSGANRFYVRHGFVVTHESEWDVHYIRPASMGPVGIGSASAVPSSAGSAMARVITTLV